MTQSLVANHSAQPFGGLTAPLWPIRYKPLPDELLSSWLVRLAHGHGLKVQSFCNLLFGNRLQVWNRDIDRLAPDWLIDGLIAGTGTSRDRAHATTLRVFEGLLYPRYKESGNLPWILALKIFHRKREGFGQQFCIGCLRDDPVPYFRKIWRLGLVTYCRRHQCLLEDRCPQCGEPATFFRIDIGQLEIPDRITSAHCSQCHCLLSKGTMRPIPSVDRGAEDWLSRVVDQVERVSCGEAAESCTADLAVLKCMIKLLLTRSTAVKLSDYVGDCLGRPRLDLPPVKRPVFESVPLDARRELLIRAAWLMADLRTRINDAVRARVVRYNHLVHEFPDIPREFGDLARSVLRRRLPTHGVRKVAY